MPVVQEQKPNGAANQRRDSLHKASAKLAAANRLIVVGNVNAARNILALGRSVAAPVEGSRRAT